MLFFVIVVNARVGRSEGWVRSYRKRDPAGWVRSYRKRDPAGWVRSYRKRDGSDSEADPHDMMYGQEHNDWEQGDFEHFPWKRSAWRLGRDLAGKRGGNERLNHLARFAREPAYYLSRDLPVPLALRYENPFVKKAGTYLRML